MQTLKSLRDQVLNWLDEAGDTGTTKTNVDNAINIAHQQRCAADRWSFMEWQQPITFSLNSGQQYYSLHQQFGRPKYFWNQTQKIFLTEVPPRTQPEHVDWNTDTTGAGFQLQGYAQVQNQPASASVVTIVSTSASDSGTSKAITIRGDTTSGIRSETISPIGTTPTSGAILFNRILDVSLGDVWAGTLTLSAGSATLLTLTAGEFGRQYPQLRLLYLPDSTDVIEYDFYQIPRPLTADYHIPQIPFPFSQILVYDALLMLAAYDNQTDGGRISIWRQSQQQLDQQMRQSFLEGQSLQARVRYIRDIDDGQAYV